MKTERLLLPLLCIALLVSCTKVNTTAKQPRAVIEAYLQPGIAAQIMVSKELITGTDNSGNKIINGLTITVMYNGNVYIFVQNSLGVYENANMPVVAGGKYDLQFTYNNEVITASTIVPEKPANFTCSPSSITIPSFGGGIPSFPEPLKLKWNNSNNNYHYLVIKSIDPAAGKINTNGAPSFNNNPEQSASKEINFRQFTYYGRNALILYRVQPELAALYNASGSNSQNLTTTPTNINNGLGIFTAINIADTVFVTVN